MVLLFPFLRTVFFLRSLCGSLALLLLHLLSPLVGLHLQRQQKEPQLVVLLSVVL